MHMQQAGQLTSTSRTGRKQVNGTRRPEPSRPKAGRAERRRVETVVETLATLRGHGETLAEAAHDARNMVTALGLYCDLLEEPGVLTTPFMHYGHELRLVAAASRRLVERIVMIDAQSFDEQIPGARGSGARSFDDRTAGARAFAAQTAGVPGIDRKGIVSFLAPAASAMTLEPEEADRSQKPAATAGRAREIGSSTGANINPNRRWDLMPALPISNLAAELLANRNLLAALAGPAVALTVDTEAGARPVRLTGEDLTRVLVNLVKNATEAMPRGGRIAIGLREQPAGHGAADCLELSVEDNGPGISCGACETIFNSGYSTHLAGDGANGDWALNHRGLGLTISRSIIEAAGGRITARNRAQGGACFTVELPLRRTGY
jgi:signal transduction histidine kinase